MKFFNKFILSSLAVAALATTGCKKDYLHTTPSTEIADADLFKTTTSAYTLLHGMHRLSVSAGAGGQTNPLDFGIPGMYLCQDIMAQDIIITNSNYDWAIFHYQYVATEGANYWMPYNYWSFFYQLINNANHLIKNIDNVSGPEGDKLDIKGQALAYRAMSYFYLVNLFSKHYNAGDLNAPGVPIYTEPTDANTIHQGRGTIAQVYNRILTDIQDAITLLEEAGKNYSTAKYMISLDVARGLYARIALTINDWPTAANQAELAKSAYILGNPTTLTTGFNSNADSEWMWASDLTGEQYEARGLRTFIGWMDEEGAGYANVGTYRYITKDLYDKIDANDSRKEWFQADRKQRKFKFANKTSVEFNDLLMRAAEMHLIEAEARYRNGEEGDAKLILESLVQTRYTNGATYTAPSGPALLEEILLQRRIELWAEGQAFFDVTRLQRGLNRATGTGNHQRSVTGGVLTLPANDAKFLFKLPQREIDANQAIDPNEQN